MAKPSVLPARHHSVAP